MTSEIINLPGITFRFSSRFMGILVDNFPEVAGITEVELTMGRGVKAGAIKVNGESKVGTRIQFTAINGEAVYEITGRAISSIPTWIIERRNYKVMLAGDPVEVKVFGLSDLSKLFDTWPNAIALRADVMDPPEGWRKNIRFRPNEVIFRANESEALYELRGRHPLHERPPVWLAQRKYLLTKQGQIVHLPSVALTGNSRGA